MSFFCIDVRFKCQPCNISVFLIFNKMHDNHELFSTAYSVALSWDRLWASCTSRRKWPDGWIFQLPPLSGEQKAG